MIAKLICRLFGHRRGRRTGVLSSFGVGFRCPRCGTVWNRKIRGGQ